MHGAASALVREHPRRRFRRSLALLPIPPACRVARCPLSTKADIRRRSYPHLEICPHGDRTHFPDLACHLDGSHHSGIVVVVLEAPCEPAAPIGRRFRRDWMPLVRGIPGAMGSGINEHGLRALHLAQVPGRCIQCYRFTHCVLGRGRTACCVGGLLSGWRHHGLRADVYSARLPKLMSASGRRRTATTWTPDSSVAREDRTAFTRGPAPHTSYCTRSPEIAGDVEPRD